MPFEILIIKSAQKKKCFGIVALGDIFLLKLQDISQQQ